MKKVYQDNFDIIASDLVNGTNTFINPEKKEIANINYTVIKIGDRFVFVSDAENKYEDIDKLKSILGLRIKENGIYVFNVVYYINPDEILTYKIIIKKNEKLNPLVSNYREFFQCSDFEK